MMEERAGEKEGREVSVAELRYLYRAYTERHALVAEEVKNVITEKAGFEGALATINKMEDVRNRGTLISIGPGIFMKGLVEEEEKVLVNVGGKYIVEKKIEEARKFLDKRIKGEGEILTGLIREREELESAIMELSYRMEKAQGEQHV